MLEHIVLFLHIIGGSIWAGGHLVLAITILPKALSARSPEILHSFESRYEKIGIPALLTQIVTGIILAINYSGNLFMNFDFASPLHSYISIKLILLALTIIIAAHARIRLIGKLREENLNFLAAHIITVTILAVLLVFFGVGIRVGGW
jgi:putative copper export protein